MRDQSYTLLGDGQIVPESGIRQEQILPESPKYRCGENGSDQKIFGGDF